MKNTYFTLKGCTMPLFLLLFSSLICFQASAQPIISLTPVISTGLSSPIQFVNADDGTNRIFIVQQGGTIRAYDQNYNFLSNFLTVSDVLFSGEQGLLSLAFHPDYETNGFFYVYYVNGFGNLEIARYHISANANVADAASKVIVLTIPHPTNANHNGGELHFGSDGYLYLSTGDGGSGGDPSNNAQNTSVLLGKMLRLAVNTSPTFPFYTSAPGNPYGNEIYALGLRNPFRWSFDRQTQDMWIGDVGQNEFEEIDFRAAGTTLGANYGWRCYEGNADYLPNGCGAKASYVFPVYTYAPASSIIGGVVYRGTAYPSMQGYYISADFYNGKYYILGPNGLGGFTTTVQTGAQNNLSDFGETENGEIYTVSLTGNTVYRITSTATVPLTLVDFSGTTKNNGVELNWKTSSETDLMQFEIEYSNNGQKFEKAGIVKAKNLAIGGEYTFEHAPKDMTNGLFYRLKMIDNSGEYSYSKVLNFMLNKNGKTNFIYPSIVNNNVLNVSLTESFNSLEIININGQVIFQQNIDNRVGQFDVRLNNMTSGTYLVRIKKEGKDMSQKIVVQ